MTDLARILVSGGQGSLGKALGARGCTALGREDLDVTLSSSIAAAIKQYSPALIINCAAYTDVDKAENDEAAAYAINEGGAKTLAAACLEGRIPLIHISTDSVFGDRDPSRQVLETDLPGPLSVYGASKRAGEEAILETARLRVCIARVSWLFADDSVSFISKILTAAKSRDTLQLVDDAHGRPTPVVDLANQLVALADRMLVGMPIPEILHLGPREAVSRYGWAQAIFDRSAQVGGPVPELFACSSDDFPQVARRPRGLVLDVATATALLGPMPSWRIASNAAVDNQIARK